LGGHPKAKSYPENWEHEKKKESAQRREAKGYAYFVRGFRKKREKEVNSR